MLCAAIGGKKKWCRVEVAACLNVSQKIFRHIITKGDGVEGMKQPLILQPGYYDVVDCMSTRGRHICSVGQRVIGVIKSIKKINQSKSSIVHKYEVGIVQTISFFSCIEVK